MKRSNSRSHFGFTLIELLVVIAIIAILAAILFPVFEQARAKARQTACLSNMKQIGLAVIQYNQDYDETEPMGAVNRGITQSSCSPLSGGCGAASPYTAGYKWMDEIYPYIKTEAVFECPDDGNPLDSYNYIFRSGAGGYAFGAYAANDSFDQNGEYPSYPGHSLGEYGPINLTTGVPLNKIVSPSDVIFCADATGSYNGQFGDACAFSPPASYGPCNEDPTSGKPPCAIVATFRGFQTLWPNSTNPPTNSNPNTTALIARHPGNMMNIAFCDGHAKTMTPSQIINANTLGPHGYPKYLSVGGG